MLHKMYGHISNDKAFTLIEVIASLVLIGIMAAVVGLGLVQITQGYLFTKQNSETVQKTQIAMTRIVKELATATSIDTSPLPTSTVIKYTRTGTSTVSNTITISSVIQMSGATNGTLINNVVTPPSAFAYFNAAGTQFTPTATTVSQIRRINITIRVTGANNHNSDFTDSVSIMEPYK